MSNANTTYSCECHDLPETRGQGHSSYPQNPDHASMAYSYAQWHHQMAMWWWNTYYSNLASDTATASDWTRALPHQTVYPALRTNPSAIDECCKHDNTIGPMPSGCSLRGGSSVPIPEGYDPRMHHFMECGPGNDAHSTSHCAPAYSEHQMEDNDADDDEDIQLEVHEGFRKFLEISEKHRQERRRQEELKNDDVEYVEVGTIRLKATTEAPKEQPGVLKAEEMKRLYGNDANKIHSLETALQMHYDLNCDLRHPVYWPSIPLKF